MRFKRQGRFPFEDTSRKRAALRRRQQKDREALPLFAEQIAESQPSEDDEMRNRGRTWDTREARDRAARAAQWREARQQIAAMSPKERSVLRRAWNCAPYPADPARMLSFLHSYRIGRFRLDNLPFPLIRTDPHGCRFASLFTDTASGRLVNILQARDIAAQPMNYSPSQRLAAYHHLQAAANKNKDRERAKLDRVLSADLFMKLEDAGDRPQLEQAVQR